MHTFGMKALKDTPCEKHFPNGCMQRDSLQRRRILLDSLECVHTSFVDLDLIFSEEESIYRQPSINTVNLYAKEVLNLGLLFLEFCDSVSEGDGNRIFRCLRYFLPLFKKFRSKKLCCGGIHTVGSRNPV